MTNKKTEQVVTVVEETITRTVSASFIDIKWKLLLSELVATMMLMMFFGCMSCMPVTNAVLPPLYGALGFGMTVGILVQCFAHISGAHMNPAVTLGAWVMGKITTFLAIGYVVMQVIGAILGYGLLMGLTNHDFVGNKICCTLPYAGYDFYHAIGIEFFLTAALIMVCCSVWDPANLNNESLPLKFMMTIAGLSIVGGPLTGASMNPARSLAPAVWTGIYTGHWYYWVGPLLGAGVSSLLYKLVWLKKPVK